MAVAAAANGNRSRGTTRRRVLGACSGLLAGAPAAGVLAGAAGCAGPGGIGERPAVVKGPAVARVLLMSNPVFTAVQTDLVAAQAEVDPGLQLEMSVFPGQIAQFREKLVAIYAGGDVPDAQWVHPSVVSLFGSKNLLRPLEEFARQDRETPLGDFYPGVLTYFRWRETAYALPWYSPGWVLVFNRDLFDRRASRRRTGRSGRGGGPGTGSSPPSGP